MSEWMKKRKGMERKGNEWGIKYGIQMSRSRKFCEPITPEMIWTKIPIVGGVYFFFFLTLTLT